MQTLPYNKMPARTVSSFRGAGLYRTAAEGFDPTILSEIYREDINIAIWQRALPSQLQYAIGDFVDSRGSFKMAISTTPSRAFSAVSSRIGGGAGTDTISHNVAELADMFCCLFDLTEVGLRMSVLDHAMCPRFHFDRVPCRLVSTYQGVGTEWLPHVIVDRAQQWPATPEFTGLNLDIGQAEASVRQLSSGDVALLKGTHWEGNEHAGLVHRSPALQPGDLRLVLTMDFLG